MSRFVQPRLYPDVAKCVLRSAALYSRTVPAEVNRILREYYKEKSFPKPGKP